jgi:Endosomal/lysosomal potassium channel TMEM175
MAYPLTGRLRRTALAGVWVCTSNECRRERRPAQAVASIYSLAMSGAPEGRLSEKSRVEFFSDGVFAIAVTLLVLELAIPETRGAFGKELLDESMSYVAYLAAFGTIGVLWLVHHATFTRIRKVDIGVLWRNLVLLLSASLFPFPTAVIASAFRDGDGTDQAASVVSTPWSGCSPALPG